MTRGALAAAGRRATRRTILVIAGAAVGALLRPRTAAADLDPGSVNSYSGNFAYRATDVEIPAFGLPFRLTRTYNSQASNVGAVGPQWRTDLNWIITSTRDYAAVTSSGGRVDTFPVRSDGTFETRFGWTPIRLPDGRWLLRTASGIHYEFNQIGRRTRAFDDYGHYVDIEVDSLGITRSMTDYEGRTITFEYDAGGRNGNKLLKVTDPFGRSLTYGYTQNNRLESVTDPLGAITVYAYSAGGHLSSITDPNGATLSLEYDRTGRVLQRQDRAGATVSFEYIPTSAEVVGITGPDGRALPGLPAPAKMLLRGVRIQGPGPGQRGVSMLNEVGDTVYEEDSFGRRETRLFTPIGTLLAAQDRNGNVWRYAVQGVSPRLLTTIDPGGGRWTLAYEHGRLTERIDPMGRRWRYGYQDGRLTLVTDPSGRTASMEWGENGRPASLTDLAGRSMAYEYDSHGSVVRAIRGDSEITHDYDEAGRAVRRVDSEGRSQFAYDAVGRLIRITSAAGWSIVAAYDAAGVLTSLDEGGAIPVRIEYDPKHRVTAIRRGEDVVGFAYNGGGEVTRMTDARGRSIEVEYDEDDRLVATSYRGQQRTMERDGNGNIIAVSGGAGRRIALRYSFRNQIESVAREDGRRVAFDYDASGVLLRATDERGDVTTYADALALGLHVQVSPADIWVSVVPRHPSEPELPVRSRQITLAGEAAARPFLRVLFALEWPDGLANLLLAAPDPFTGLAQLGYTLTFERQLAARLRAIIDLLGAEVEITRSLIVPLGHEAELSAPEAVDG